jgi:hypothetical protein
LKQKVGKKQNVLTMHNEVNKAIQATLLVLLLGVAHEVLFFEMTTGGMIYIPNFMTIS